MCFIIYYSNNYKYAVHMSAVIVELVRYLRVNKIQVLVTVASGMYIVAYKKKGEQIP